MEMIVDWCNSTCVDKSSRGSTLFYHMYAMHVVLYLGTLKRKRGMPPSPTLECILPKPCSRGGGSGFEMGKWPRTWQLREGGLSSQGFKYPPTWHTISGSRSRLLRPPPQKYKLDLGSAVKLCHKKLLKRPFGEWNQDGYLGLGSHKAKFV